MVQLLDLRLGEGTDSQFLLELLLEGFFEFLEFVVGDFFVGDDRDVEVDAFKIRLPLSKGFCLAGIECRSRDSAACRKTTTLTW